MQLGCSGVEICSFTLETRFFGTSTLEVMKGFCFPYAIRGFTHSVSVTSRFECLAP